MILAAILWESLGLMIVLQGFIASMEYKSTLGPDASYPGLNTVLP